MTATRPTVRATPADAVKAGLHGSVYFRDGQITAIYVRGDNQARAYENRFHELLHVLELKAGISLSHDDIRRLSRAYANNVTLCDAILNFRS